MSDQLKRCPLLYDWCSLTYTKLEIILFSFHCRVIRQQKEINTVIEAGNYLKFTKESSEKPIRRQNKTLI